jgi:hypothetical protein
MFRYKRRTLLFVLALGPPVIAGAWWGCAAWRARLRPVGYSVQPDGSQIGGREGPAQGVVKSTPATPVVQLGILIAASRVAVPCRE